MIEYGIDSETFERRLTASVNENTQGVILEGNQVFFERFDSRGKKIKIRKG